MNIQTGSPACAVSLSNPWAVVPSLGHLDAYISAVNRMPMLTLEQEQTFARLLKDNNDLEAAGKLIMSHLRLVVHDTQYEVPKSSTWRVMLPYLQEVKSTSMIHNKFPPS